MTNDPFRAVLVDYDEDLFAPPDWVGEELGRQGIEWIVGRHRTPEAALEAARAGDVVMVQVGPSVAHPIRHRAAGAVSVHRAVGHRL